MAASALAASVGADASFAPREGRTYHETVTQIRDDGSGAEQFTIERTIVFSRDEHGWRATVTFGPARHAAKSGAVALFERAMAALAGTVIRYRLDASGAVTAIEEEAAQWQRFVATVAALGGQDEAQAQDFAAIAKMLATLPDDQRRETLSEPITPVIGAEDVARGARPATQVTIPARSSLGIQASIPGTTTATDTAAAIRIVTEGAGPFGTTGTPQGTLHFKRSREIDKATGLIRETREETVTDVQIGGSPARQSITITTVLTY